MTFQYDRVPRWIVGIGAIGTPVTGIVDGPMAALGFALGVAGSWWNYRGLVKTVTGLTSAAAAGGSPNVVGMVGGLFLRLVILGAAAIAILKYSKISLVALLVGLFASMIAICLEITYELLWAKSTKSG